MKSSLGKKLSAKKRMITNLHKDCTLLEHKTEEIDGDQTNVDATVLRRTGIVCAIFHCDNRSCSQDLGFETRAFHRFPKDPILCAAWVNRCRRSDIDEMFKFGGTEYCNRNYRVCSDHFPSTSYNNPNNKCQGLQKGTIPSINLPGCPMTIKAAHKRSSLKKEYRSSPPPESEVLEPDLVDNVFPNTVQSAAEAVKPEAEILIPNHSERSELMDPAGLGEFIILHDPPATVRETTIANLSTVPSDSNTATNALPDDHAEKRWSPDLILPDKDFRPDGSDDEIIESVMMGLDAKNKRKEDIDDGRPLAINLLGNNLPLDIEAKHQSNSYLMKPNIAGIRHVDGVMTSTERPIKILPKLMSHNLKVEDMCPVFVKKSDMLNGRNDLLGLGSEKGIPVYASRAEKAMYEREHKEGLIEVNLNEPVLSSLSHTPTDLSSFLDPISLFEFACEYLGNLDDILLTRFSIGKDNYAEVRRFYEMCQMNGELLPDLSVQLLLPLSEPRNPVRFFVRAFGRMVASGCLYNGADVVLLARCLRSDRSVCIGLQVSKYRYRLNENSKAYINVQKEWLMTNGFLTQVPFEALFSSSCQGVVECAVYSPVTSFKRGLNTVTGVQVVCSQCQNLDSMLSEHIKGTKWADLNAALIEHEEVSKVMRYSKQKELSSGFHQLPPDHEAPRTNPLSVECIKRMFSHNLEDVLNTVTNAQFYRFYEPIESRSASGRIRKNQKRNHADVIQASLASHMDDPRPRMQLSEGDFNTLLEVGVPSDVKSVQLLRRCLICDFQAPTLMALFTHVKEHMGNADAGIMCEICGIYSRNESALFEHEQSLHRTVLFKHQCLKCMLEFSDFNFIKDHVNKHRAHPTIRCTICPQYVTYTMGALQKHMLRCHHIRYIKKFDHFKCEVCNQNFWLPDSLLVHQVNRKHGNQLACPICHNVCGLPASLRAHLLATHTDEERDLANMAVCTLCHKVFFSPFHLSYHYHSKHGGNKGQDPLGLVDNIIFKSNFDNQDGLDETAMGNDSGCSLTLQSKMKVRLEKSKVRLKRGGGKLKIHTKHLKSRDSTMYSFFCPLCPKMFRYQKSCEKHMEICGMPPHSKIKNSSGTPSLQREETKATHPPELEDSLAAVYLEKHLASGNTHDANAALEEIGDGQMYQCDECGLLYVTRQQVIEHIQSDHSKQLQQVHKQRQQLQMGADIGSKQLPAYETRF